MSKKKYKLKGVRKYFKFGKTPEGEPFLEIVENTLTARFLSNGYIEFYEKGELIYTFDATLSREPKLIVPKISINASLDVQKIISQPTTVKRGVIE